MCRSLRNIDCDMRGIFDKSHTLFDCMQFLASARGRPVELLQKIVAIICMHAARVTCRKLFGCVCSTPFASWQQRRCF